MIIRCQNDVCCLKRKKKEKKERKIRKLCVRKGTYMRQFVYFSNGVFKPTACNNFGNDKLVSVLGDKKWCFS